MKNRYMGIAVYLMCINIIAAFHERLYKLFVRTMPMSRRSGQWLTRCSDI